MYTHTHMCIHVYVCVYIYIYIYIVIGAFSSRSQNCQSDAQHSSSYWFIIVIVIFIICTIIIIIIIIINMMMVVGVILYMFLGLAQRTPSFEDCRHPLEARVTIVYVTVIIRSITEARMPV